MKRIVMVIAPKKFQEDEYFIPRKYFEKYGYEVVVASTHLGIMEGYKGSKVNADSTIDEIDCLQYDALVIVGGFGCKNFLWDYRPLHSKLLETYEYGKTIAAICLAPVCIVKTGILRGKRATAYKNKAAKLEFEKAEVEYISDVVYVNDRIVTANGPKSSGNFAKEIIKQIENDI